MDVESTKAVIEDHDRDIRHRAQVCELLSAEREPLFDGVAAHILHSRDHVDHESTDEEEDDPVLFGIILGIVQIWILVRPPAQAEAFHEQAVQEQSDVCVDYLVV